MSNVNINVFVLYLPFFVSVFWGVLLFINRKINTYPQNIWILLLVVIAICSFIKAMLFGNVDNYSLYYNYKLNIVDTRWRN